MNPSPIVIRTVHGVEEIWFPHEHASHEGARTVVTDSQEQPWTCQISDHQVDLAPPPDSAGRGGDAPLPQNVAR